MDCTDISICPSTLSHRSSGEVSRLCSIFTDSNYLLLHELQTGIHITTEIY